MPHQDPAPKSELPPDAPRVAEQAVASQDLFRGQTEIFIDHEGERYRLRITRRNKLILQK